MEFKLGDRVICKAEDHPGFGRRGTLVELWVDGSAHTIEFDEAIEGGHAGRNQKGRDRHCRHLQPMNIQLDEVTLIERTLERYE